MKFQLAGKATAQWNARETTKLTHHGIYDYS